MARPVPEQLEAAQIQLDLFRRATPARRIAIARTLSATTIALARAAIRRRHPDWSERDVLLEFVRVHYGAELAEHTQRYLALRDQ